jgi:hypothetical protein
VAEVAWRCSQSGTVNAPVANACRTCGRWPSLFELEGSTLEADTDASARSAAPVADADPFAAQTVDVAEPEPEVFDPDGLPDEVDLPPEFDGDEEPGTDRPRWRSLARLIVPIAAVVYVLVSVLVDRG